MANIIEDALDSALNLLDNCGCGEDHKCSQCHVVLLLNKAKESIEAPKKWLAACERVRTDIGDIAHPDDPEASWIDIQITLSDGAFRCLEDALESAYNA